MKQVAPDDEDGRPQRAFTVKNGEWTCITCGQALSARRLHPGRWEAGIPSECPHDVDCAQLCATLAESMYDPETACLPPN